jgi:signal transduction histidine kinase
MRKYLIYGWFIAPGGLLLFFRLWPGLDPAVEAPLFHFYVVTFTAFATAVLAVLLLLALGPVARLRHLLAAIAFATMALLLFVHGITTPEALTTHFHPAVQWSAWLTLLTGAAIFVLASHDGPNGAPEWLTVARVGAVLAPYLVVYLVVALFLPDWLMGVNQRLPPERAIFIASISLWGLAAVRLWRIWQVSGDRVDQVLVLVAFWLAASTLSLHQFPLWHLSWWLYHFFLLAAVMLAFYILTMAYEQARQFRLLPYYVATSLIVTALLTLIASYLFGAFAVDVLAHRLIDPALVIADARIMGLVVAALTMSVLFLALLLIIYRAERIINTRNAQLAEAYASLRHSESLREDLVEMIVHDLRTPLTAIGINVDLMGRTIGQDMVPKQVRYVDNLRQASARMNQMINDILIVSKLEAGEFQLQLHLAVVHDLLAERVHEFTVQATTECKELVLTCPPDLLVTMDSALIGRVVENLVSNAMKYTESNGHIHVEARLEGEQIVVAVCDTGVGVPDDYKEQIFGKYLQVPASEKRPPRIGTGLGLAFCRLAVEAHGGRIWVEDGAGGGSVFKFWLPGALTAQAVRT